MSDLWFTKRYLPMRSNCKRRTKNKD